MSNEQSSITNSSKTIQTIALFGTSADPPTAGHQAILQWLSERYDWVAVWASDNPFKRQQISLTHRMTMLRLLIVEMDTPRQNISLEETLSDRRSLISVKKAQAIWGDNLDYTLVIGSDLVQQIRSWYRVDELLEKVKILLIPRRGYPIQEEDLDSLRYLGGRFSLAELNIPAVSSTDYRENHDKTVVTQPIKDYIHREQLYA